MTLINKESLLLVMNTLSENADPSVLDWEFAVDVVRTAPEADHVLRGKWIEDADGDGRHCSICGNDYAYLVCDCEKYRYCPNCGAKMDEVVLQEEEGEPNFPWD